MSARGGTKKDLFAAIERKNERIVELEAALKRAVELIANWTGSCPVDVFNEKMTTKDFDYFCGVDGEKCADGVEEQAIKCWRSYLTKETTLKSEGEE